MISAKSSLVGSRKKIAKCLMRSFTCCFTFLNACMQHQAINKKKNIQIIIIGSGWMHTLTFTRTFCAKTNWVNCFLLLSVQLGTTFLIFLEKISPKYWRCKIKIVRHIYERLEWLFESVAALLANPSLQRRKHDIWRNVLYGRMPRGKSLPYLYREYSTHIGR